MITISDIIGYVESQTNHKLNRDEGMQFKNDVNRTVHGVTVAWMATPGAIQSAGEAGHELLIAHESVYFPYDVLNATNPPENWREWKVNKQRIDLFNNYDLSCVRMHGSVDEICIFDTFADLFDLGNPVYTDGLVKIYETAPISLGDLIALVKNRMEMPYLRVAGVSNLSRKVHRIGLPWGGLGLFVNVNYQQNLIMQECDAFIAGESDSYGFRFAVEAGIPMIETGHELSENPGLKKFTEILMNAFPDVTFSFYESKSIWQII